MLPSTQEGKTKQEIMKNPIQANRGEKIGLQQDQQMRDLFGSSTVPNPQQKRTRGSQFRSLAELTRANRFRKVSTSLSMSSTDLLFSCYRPLTTARSGTGVLRPY